MQLWFEMQCYVFIMYLQLSHSGSYFPGNQPLQFSGGGKIPKSYEQLPYPPECSFIGGKKLLLWEVPFLSAIVTTPAISHIAPTGSKLVPV